MGSSRAGVQVRVPGLRDATGALVALVLTALVLYHETVFSLVKLWTIDPDPTYHHGLPVSGICAFLFCRRWMQVRPIMRVRPSSSAAALVLLGSCIWLLASLVHVVIVQQVTLMLLLPLLVVTIVGYRSALLLAFPMALLSVTVPVWEPLRSFAQHATAHVAAFLVSLTGISTLLDGTEISVPAGTFNVAPSCSGMAYLLVGTMTGALFAYAHELRRKAFLWVLLASVAVSFSANALRIATVVTIGQLTEMQHRFVLHDHSALGWGLFGSCMLVFLLIASGLVGPVEEESGAPHTGAAGPRYAEGNDVGVARTAMLGLGALAFGPLLLYAYQSEGGDIRDLVLDVPAQIGSWRALPAPPHGYRPAYQLPDLEYETLYRDPSGRDVYLYVAHFARQAQGKEAVSKANSVSDPRIWWPVLTRTRHLDDNSDVQETWLRSMSGAQKLVWQWYYVHGTAVSNRYKAKVLNAWGALNRDPAASLIVVAADAGDEGESSEALLRLFVADTKRTVEHAIDGIRRR